MNIYNITPNGQTLIPVVIKNDKKIFLRSCYKIGELSFCRKEIPVVKHVSAILVILRFPFNLKAKENSL